MITSFPAKQNRAEAELREIAEQLACAAERLCRVHLDGSPGGSDQNEVRAPDIKVRSYLRARRARGKVLPEQLFGEPAWDMLLDLFASEIEGRSVSISSACIAAAVPPTTALRWIGKLQELGMIVRSSDSLDARRAFLQLREQSRAAIADWVEHTLS